MFSSQPTRSERRNKHQSDYYCKTSDKGTCYIHWTINDNFHHKLTEIDMAMSHEHKDF